MRSNRGRGQRSSTASDGRAPDSPCFDRPAIKSEMNRAARQSSTIVPPAAAFRKTARTRPAATDSIPMKTAANKVPLSPTRSCRAAAAQPRSLEDGQGQLAGQVALLQDPDPDPAEHRDEDRHLDREEPRGDADRHAAEADMGQGISEGSRAAQDHEHAEDAADGRDHEARDQRSLHEPELEDAQQIVRHGTPQWPWVCGSSSEWAIVTVPPPYTVRSKASSCNARGGPSYTRVRLRHATRSTRALTTPRSWDTKITVRPSSSLSRPRRS